jgi:hypothetical protein
MPGPVPVFTVLDVVAIEDETPAPDMRKKEEGRTISMDVIIELSLW